MAFIYGTPISLRGTEEEDEQGRKYGEPEPIVFGNYSKVTYGTDVPMLDLDPITVTPPEQRSMMVERPDPEQIKLLQQKYGTESRLTQQERMLTSSAPGGGPLGLQSEEELLEQKYPGVRDKMKALEDAAWEGREESGWGELFSKTLSSILPKFRRQIVGGMRGGNPVTVSDLQRNADVEIGQVGAGTGTLSQSIENNRIAKEWGFEEGSDKVQPGVHPVDAFAEWLESDEGRGEVESEAAKTPVALIAQDIWDAETGKIKENALQVKPQSVKYYAAGILDAGINMGPAMAATVVTKNPMIGASIMGGQVYGDTYGHMLDEGYSPDQAMQAALFSAAAETLTERISLGVLTSNNFTGLKRILAGAGAEGIQEPVTEALQIGYDVGILNDEMTMGEAMWRLIDAGIIGFGVGGGMGASVEVLQQAEQMTTPAAREAFDYDQKMDALHLSLTVQAQEARALEVLEDNTELLDKVINDQLEDISTEDLAALEEQELIKINDDGSITALPKARRQVARQTVEVNRNRKKEALRSRGVSDDELGPTVEILDMQPAFHAAEADTDLDATDEQKGRGNYRKGRFTWNNIPLAIETPAGETRSGVDDQGRAWSQVMTSGYGYFPSKPGADTVEGEPTEGVDAYFGPDLNTPTVYVINQAKDASAEAVGENFDEHKVMVGYPSLQAAIDAYKADYAPARDQQVEGVAMQPDQFKAWLNRPTHTVPVSLGTREGYEQAPVFATIDKTKPTPERYPARGKNVTGSPPKMRAFKDIDKLIDKTVAILEDSELVPTEAWTWYEDSGRKIREITRNDPELMHDVIKILAATSQGVSVGANTTFMIKAAYQIAKGEQIDTGLYPATAVSNIETMRELASGDITNELPGIGSKVMSFYRNLYDSTFNTNRYDSDVTIDRWMVRNLGYTAGDSVEGTQYEYARKIFQDATARYNARNGTNWLPRHAQAALWVHERSKASLKKTGKPTPVDAFAEHIEAVTARVTHEAVPSKATAEGRQVEALPREEKEELGRRQREALAENNTHVVMEALNVPLYNVDTAVGGYQGMINPNEISNIVMVGGTTIDRPTVDIFATIMQYIYTQESVPWFRADRKAKTSEKTGDFGRKYTQGVNWDLQGPLNEDQETALFDALRKALGRNAGFSMAAPDQLVIIDFKDEKGVTDSGLKPAEFIEKIDKILDNIGADLGVVSSYSFGAEGNDLKHDWETDPNGQKLEAAIEDYASTTGPPDLLKRVRGWRKSAQGITRDFLKADARPRAGAAASVPVARLGDRSAIEDAVFQRFGSVDRTRDTTEELKYYDLTPVVENPEVTDRLADQFGYTIEVFSFEVENFRLPRLGKKNYEEGTVWIYDPAAEHGSFKDETYTRAWRVSHEIAHGITERLMQERYGDSKRYGRLGRTMIGERGKPPKRIDVELEPLTLMQAQRAVEWEDVTFRVQRILLDKMGISIPDSVFNQEYNVNIADATFRIVTGDFSDAGEFGFRPSVFRPSIKSILTGLERTEQALAEDQGREATKGIDLSTHNPISDEALQESIDLQSRAPVDSPLFSVVPGVPADTKWYRGSEHERIRLHRETGIVHASTSEKTASAFGPVSEVTLHVQNPFDYENPEHAKALKAMFNTNAQLMKFARALDVVHGGERTWLGGEGGIADVREYFNIGLEMGNYQTLESPAVLEAIRGMGHDSVYMVEDDFGPKGIAVFDAGLMTRDAPLFATIEQEVFPGFYSGLSRAARKLKQEKGTGEQMLAMLTKMPGVKAEELDWTGTPEFLKAKKTVTKDQLIAFIDANGVRIEETTLGFRGTGTGAMPDDVNWQKVQDDYESGDVGDVMGLISTLTQEQMEVIEDRGSEYVTWESLTEEQKNEFAQFAYKVTEAGVELVPTQYGGSDLQLPGGKYYRELLLRLPSKSIDEIPERVPTGWVSDATVRSLNQQMAVRFEAPMAIEQRDLLLGGSPTEIMELLDEWGELGLDVAQARSEVAPIPHSQTVVQLEEGPGGEDLADMMMTDFHDAGLPLDDWGWYEEDSRFVFDNLNTDQYDAIHSIAARHGVHASIGAPEEGAPQPSKESFNAAHWSRFSNILASIRLTERIGENGERILFIEEIQSDWHKRGRQFGYRDRPAGILPEKNELVTVKKKLTETADYWEVRTKGGVFVVNVTATAEAPELPNEQGAIDQAYERLSKEKEIRDRVTGATRQAVPDAPFKGNAWAELAIKRVIRLAAEEGYDQVAWTTGQQQSERYSLSNVLEAITVAPGVVQDKPTSRVVHLISRTHGPIKVIVNEDGVVDDSDQADFTGKRLEDVIGRAMTEDIMKQTGFKEFFADAMDVGGQGMKSFYDRSMRNIFSKVIKKLDKKVKPSSTRINVGPRITETYTVGRWPGSPPPGTALAQVPQARQAQLDQLAAEARPINDDDYGTDRQINAQNDFTFTLQAILSPEKWENFAEYAHRATPEEMIDYGMSLAAEEAPPTIITHGEMGTLEVMAETARVRNEDDRNSHRQTVAFEAFFDELYEYIGEAQQSVLDDLAADPEQSEGQVIDAGLSMVVGAAPRAGEMQAQPAGISAAHAAIRNAARMALPQSRVDEDSNRQMQAYGRFTAALEAELSPNLWDNFTTAAAQRTPKQMVGYGLNLLGVEGVTAPGPQVVAQPAGIPGAHAGIRAHARAVQSRGQADIGSERQIQAYDRFQDALEAELSVDQYDAYLEGAQDRTHEEAVPFGLAMLGVDVTPVAEPGRVTQQEVEQLEETAKRAVPQEAADEGSPEQVQAYTVFVDELSVVLPSDVWDEWMAYVDNNPYDEDRVNRGLELARREAAAAPVTVQMVTAEELARLEALGESVPIENENVNEGGPLQDAAMQEFLTALQETLPTYAWETWEEFANENPGALDQIEHGLVLARQENQTIPARPGAAAMVTAEDVSELKALGRTVAQAEDISAEQISAMQAFQEKLYEVLPLRVWEEWEEFAEGNSELMDQVRHGIRLARGAADSRPSQFTTTPPVARDQWGIKNSAGEWSGPYPTEEDAIERAAEREIEDLASVHVIDISDTMRKRLINDGLSLFAVTRQPAEGVPVANLQSVVSEILNLYPGSPNVKIAPTEAHLPRRQLLEIKHAGMEGKVGGMFDPETGEVYLVAGNLRNMKEAVEIYLHETVGHYGIRSILGAEYDTIMDQVWKSHKQKVMAAARRNGLDVRIPSQRRIAAEEFIAYRAQRVLAGQKLPAREASLLQRLVEAIRIAIARLRGVQMSDADIQRLIRKARMFVATPANKSPGLLPARKAPVMFANLWKAINQDRVPNSGSAAMYRKELNAQIRAGNITEADAEPLIFYLADAANIDKANLLNQIRELGNRQAFHVREDSEFREWFADSKVVDESGEPLVVYHGGPAGIDDFRPPIFVTSDRSGAEWFEEDRDGDMYELHAKIENPLDISTREGNVTLIRIAREAGVSIESDVESKAKGWSFFSEDIAKHSPYEGHNTADLAYIPAVVKALGKAGYDGIFTSDVLGNTEIPTWIAFASGQIKSAIDTRSVFHVDEYEGRADAIETGDLFENFTIEEGSKTSRAWNYLVYKAQDKFIDLLNVQRAIEAQTGRPISEELDTYLAEELFHGQVKSRVDRFEKDYIRPLTEVIDDSNYTWDEVEWFLYARHAPEANRRLYRINRSGALRRSRDTTKKKAEAKLEKRIARIDATKATQRNKIEAEHAKRLAVIESEYRSQMRRSKERQKKRREGIEATKARKIQRADARKAQGIGQLETKYKYVRADYELTYQVEIEEADVSFREREQERVKEDPGLLALSGMSNADAALAMETLKDKGDISQLETIAAQVDRMTARNREIMVNEGLEEQSTIDAWDKAYKHYVPLKGWKDGPMNTTFFPKKGKGYDTGGKLNQRRLGRRSMAANILANIVAQHQSTVVMAEKAKVGRTLLKMVQENPNADLWTANQIETKKRLDPKSGLVVTAVDPTYKLRDNVLRVKVDGKDYHITFNEESDVAMRIATSMKNLSSQEINWMFTTMLRLNRILSAINTSYNPEFIVSNLVRDLQTAMINLNATDAQNMKMAILKDVFKAHRGIRRFLDLPSFKDPESADYWREQFEEYRDLGGQVGWLDNYKDVQDLEQSLHRQMQDKSAGMMSWSTLRKLGKFIEGENQAVENAVRLSAFMHAKTAGLSPRKAASLAKNLTVNFNRKGEIGTQLNAVYLFYNASIQGMAVIWGAAKSAKVRKIMYGIVAFAASMEILNRFMAGDDDDGENRYDKIPAWVKERNMIIMIPERFRSQAPDDFVEHYITIPLPYGYNMLHVIGQKIGGIIDYTGIGNKREWSPLEDTFEILAAGLGSFNPIGTGPTPLQTISPTVLSPFVQVSENVAWHGGPVMPEASSYDPAPEPESQQYYRSVPKHAIALAEFLNKLGGGSKARPAPVSPLDISPETIQLIEDFATGGAGRFVTNTIELGVMAQEGEIDWRKVPFARRFVGVTDERAVSNRYYENRTKIEYAVQEIKVAAEEIKLSGSPAERADAMKNRARILDQYRPDASLKDVLRLTQNALKDLNALRKAVRQSRRDDDWKKEREEKIELQKTQLMNKFNRRYNQIMEKRRQDQEETAMNPQLPGKQRLAAAQQFNKAGYPATANLIRMLPVDPGADFVERLNA